MDSADSDTEPAQTQQTTMSFGSQGRQSRAGSLRNQNSKKEDDQVDDDPNDDAPFALLRSKSSVLLPVRSLSPFRSESPPQVGFTSNGVVSDSSGRSTPELRVESKESTEAEDDSVNDLFKLQFRKSLLKALNSFSEARDKPSVPAKSDEDQSPSTPSADLSEPEPPKKQQVAVPLKKPKTRKRKLKQAVVDTPSPKVSKKKLKTRTRTSMITRASAAKVTRDTPDQTSGYFNISQSKVHIFKAAEAGNLQVVRELLCYTGCTIRHGKRNNTLLHVAAANAQSDVILYLLNLISPNLTNKDGQTAAHLAAMNGHTQILKILLADTEFNPDQEDSFQRTFRDMLVAPLFEACLLGDRKRLEVLLELGADPDYHAGKLVEGILSRELRVTTARQLAYSIYGQRFTAIFSKGRKDYVNSLKITFTRENLVRKPNFTAPTVPNLVSCEISL